MIDLGGTGARGACTCLAIILALQRHTKAFFFLGVSGSRCCSKGHGSAKGCGEYGGANIHVCSPKWLNLTY